MRPGSVFGNPGHPPFFYSFVDIINPVKAAVLQGINLRRQLSQPGTNVRSRNRAQLINSPKSALTRPKLPHLEWALSRIPKFRLGRDRLKRLRREALLMRQLHTRMREVLLLGPDVPRRRPKKRRAKSATSRPPQLRISSIWVVITPTVTPRARNAKK